MVVLVIIGALIGAGFASGQEIYLFFYKYGIKGIWGLFLCSLLIGILIYKTFKILLNNKENKLEKKIENYKEFSNIIFNFPNLKYKYLNLGYITNQIVNFFLLTTFFIMISGFGAYFKQEFNINNMLRLNYFSNIMFYSFYE